VNDMSFWTRFLERRAKRAIRKLPKLYRGQARFRRHYPDYSMGVGSYGLPIVHDWKEGGTLVIGAYTSIAEQVEIFLGGHHRTDWVTTYPFPAMIDEAAGIPGYAFSRGDVVIGNDVWLCTGAMILSGVTVGDGAVVTPLWLATQRNMCGGAFPSLSGKRSWRQSGGLGLKTRLEVSVRCCAVIDWRRS